MEEDKKDVTKGKDMFDLKHSSKWHTSSSFIDWVSWAP